MNLRQSCTRYIQDGSGSCPDALSVVLVFRRIVRIRCSVYQSEKEKSAILKIQKLTWPSFPTNQEIFNGTKFKCFFLQ